MRIQIDEMKVLETQEDIVEFLGTPPASGNFEAAVIDWTMYPVQPTRFVMQVTTELLAIPRGLTDFTK